jgi:hypothetical protein
VEQERSKEWVLERVKKLLTLGRNAGATDGERDNAMRMAHKLLAKYNLEMAEAELHGADVEEKRGFVSTPFYGRPWARVVAAAIGRLYFCEYVYTSATVATDTKHYFFGKQSNASVAAAIAQWVVEGVRREGRRQNPINGEGANAWLRSFSVGAANVIYYRVEEMIKEANKVKAEPGMSMVLASVYANEQSKNVVIRDQKFPKTRKGHGGKRSGNHDGAHAGRKYGQSINLNRQVGGKIQEQLT